MIFCINVSFEISCAHFCKGILLFYMNSLLVVKSAVSEITKHSSHWLKSTQCWNTSYFTVYFFLIYKYILKYFVAASEKIILYIFFLWICVRCFWPQEYVVNIPWTISVCCTEPILYTKFGPEMHFLVNKCRPAISYWNEQNNLKSLFGLNK